MIRKATFMLAADKHEVIRNLTAVPLLVAVAGLLLWVSDARAQDAPWQQPPTRQTYRPASRLNWGPGRPAGSASNETRAAQPAQTAQASESPVRAASAASETPVPEAVDEVVPDASEFSAEPVRPRFRPRMNRNYNPVVEADGMPGLAGEGCAAGNCGEDCDECVGGPLFGPGVPPLWQLAHNRLYFRGEYLMWWTKGASIPPLLITNPDETTAPADVVLGNAGTQILYGERTLFRDLRSGGRMAFGTWLDQTDNLGVEFGYIGIGKATEQFTQSSTDGVPILARPFFDVETGLQNSNVFAYPAELEGQFSATSTSEFQAAEVLFRRAMARGVGYRIEMLGGYRFQRLKESLDINNSLVVIGEGTDFAVGEGVAISDRFNTRNDFNGGEIGVATAWHRYRWSVETSMKVAMGNTHTSVNINGTTIHTPAGESPEAPQAGGLLALPSNMGLHESNHFAMVPELALNLGYDLTPRLRATFGYTLLYWSNVARPGDQIDLNVAPSQFPPPTGTSTRPEFQLRTTDYWAQGMNFGLDFRF